MEQTHPKRNLLPRLALFIALTLGTATVDSQTAAFSSIDAAVERATLRRPVYYAGAAGANYRFQSCSGGESVNCHTIGNLAGL